MSKRRKPYKHGYRKFQQVTFVSDMGPIADCTVMETTGSWITIITPSQVRYTVQPNKLLKGKINGKPV